MTTFRFVHAADLHLGSPFAGLARADAEVAARFALASREAFSDLVARTIDLGAKLLVIAGDVYDGEWKDASIGLFFARELGRLARAGVQVAMVKGNHDADSVVLGKLGLPETVRQFSSDAPETIRIDALKVALHGQSFADRVAADDLSRNYPAPEPGWFNIGVLHTSCGGYAAHATYAPCSAESLRLKGYDYWALGHVHDYEELSRDPWIVFPGCLQGRSVRECGPKGAALVHVEDGRVARVERLIVDRARWAEITVDVSDCDSEPEVLARVEAALRPTVEEAGSRPVALRLRLAGTTRLHGAFAADRRSLSDEVEAAAQRVSSEIWLEELKLATEPLARAGAAPELKSLDLAALLDGLDRDPAVQARAADHVATVSAKLPAGSAADKGPRADELDTLLAEARALVLGRLGA